MTLIIFLIISLSFSLCTNVKKGFYCLDRSKFVWCSGTNQSMAITCFKETVCKCGKTKYNPCVFSFQELDDCEGLPGDIINEPSKFYENYK
ncbi:chitinase Jessie, putative [Entamoeba histolytica HM-1:IMSS-B]|uniref:Chitinase Jessie, putative n=6 Tax=Entamoeba histolytica TaxID=5759 RepID=A0A8U0WPY6_ENTH1|nr:chitinase Jessie, putative [Entamoeba histolytica HM-1:IMSS]AAK94929.1 chitinase Jessie 1 [Entamoeba histolytica]EMD46240.1 chitinase, putative [Entamoeba histolytica KU27]EMH73951.1 chitinase Jessie, putative [Entamoeba histolytica HM-1:IMSS-B]EMS11659.1 chitinase [Entamoeba histolytica HM-3:IMSS]ENY65386.1 chitinase, putative [Entamoeba histolytica HM-1:IMSS-A]|eukprot:XP_652296.1 chitinase Jessie, putative [Entamoeba histolytica HM-1:IMSS]